MTGKGNGVDVHLLHINRKTAGSLGRIHQKEKIVLSAEYTDLLQRHNNAVDVGSMRRDDGTCVWADEFWHAVQI